jgi:hypothetical protein
MNELRGEDCLGRKLLIIGEVNTGKTTRCRQMLAELCRQGLGGRTTVIDMAPHIPPALARQRGIVGAGGYLVPQPGSGILDLRAHLDPPRLSSKSETEALAKAERNAQVIATLLDQLVPEARDILLINDVTLYLQAESAEHLIERAAFARMNTLLVNGYSGERLGGGELTARERSETGILRRWFEKEGSVVTLTEVYPAPAGALSADLASTPGAGNSPNPLSRRR